MLVDDDVYLEHYGKQGMRWGQRRAVNKAARIRNRSDTRTANRLHTKSQKTGIAVASMGAAFLANRIMLRRTLNVKTSAIAGVAAAVGTKKAVDSILNRQSDKKINDILANYNG